MPSLATGLAWNGSYRSSWWVSGLDFVCGLPMSQAMVVKRWWLWWLWWLMVVVVRAAISKHRRVISTHGKQSMGFLDKKMINDMDYPQGITDNALR